MSLRVRLQAGEYFEVAPGETVLQAALRSGVPLAHDCQLGGCGTCRVRLVEGSVTYDEWPFALSEAEAATRYALMCQARPVTDLVIEPALAGDALPAPEQYAAIIRSLHAVSPLVNHLVLEIASASLAYRPGQYMNILLEDGSTRSFSMASAPHGTLVDFHIRRLDGGRFTDRGLAAVRPGDELKVEIPCGSFVYHREDDRPLVMVATGTGLAPIKAMLEGLMDDPDCPPVSLYWGARAFADLYLHDAIPAWTQRLFDFRYVPVLSRANAAQCRNGHVQDAVLADFDDLSAHAIYLCGSPLMIADAMQAFLDRGAARVYTSKASSPAPSTRLDRMTIH
jgi:CDP-4-dehydro-6-deoxyglucose reductase